MKRTVSTSRTQATGKLIRPIALIMLTVAAMLVALTFYSGQRMDKDALDQQTALVDNALSARLARGLGELRSVAWWDDAVKYSAAKTFNKAWLDREIGAYMNESYHHDRLMILDEQNKPVYVYGENTGLSSPILRGDLRAVQGIIQQARGGPDVSPRVKSTAKPGTLYEIAAFKSRRFSRGFGAVVKIRGAPALAMASLITPSFDTNLNPPTRRIVLTIIDIKQNVLTAMGSEVLLSDISFATRDDDRLGSYRLHADNGDMLGSLRWTPKRPGTEMIENVLPLIAIALLIASAVMANLMWQIVRSNAALAEREEEARFLADHDGLTRLPNRRKLESLYGEHFANPHQDANLLLMAVIDLDRFKDINDTLGHHAGDALIQSVAARIRSRLKPGDVLARLGGDEFAVLRSVPRKDNSDKISALVLSCFKKPFGVVGHQIETGASVGIVFADQGDSFTDAIKRADIALYDAKAHGRGRSSRFNAEMAQTIEQRLALEVDLKRAIAAKELTMNYQPIVEASTGTITSVEALVRWTSPTHGSISPEIFISIAEECGMMADLGRFVINQSIKDARRWPALSTAINISPAQLRSSTIVNDLMGPCQLYGVAPERITIEITESMLMTSDDRTLRVLNDLKSKGFVLALDDFGTGYSSLAYIRDFPFDRLKIDRSFVQGLRVNDRALAIVEGVVNFGKILGREIVAEGIETEQEMQAMQSAGCTHLQGFLFSRALPADHIEALAATFGRLSAKRPSRSKISTQKASPVRLVQPSKRMAGYTNSR
ncbi:MAG: Cyclic di-GMP phosphodiesterase Gmr [Pseudomonadota bacterium]